MSRIDCAATVSGSRRLFASGSFKPLIDAKTKPSQLQQPSFKVLRLAASDPGAKHDSRVHIEVLLPLADDDRCLYGSMNVRHPFHGTIVEAVLVVANIECHIAVALNTRS